MCVALGEVNVINFRLDGYFDLLMPNDISLTSHLTHFLCAWCPREFWCCCACSESSFVFTPCPSNSTSRPIPNTKPCAISTTRCHVLKFWLPNMERVLDYSVSITRLSLTVIVNDSRAFAFEWLYRICDVDFIVSSLCDSLCLNNK